MCVKAEDGFARNLEESPRRFRHQHGAAVCGEQQDAVLQVAENLVEILFQRREDFLNIAHALADALDLGRYLRGSVQVRPRLGFFCRDGLACRGSARKSNSRVGG